MRGMDNGPWTALGAAGWFLAVWVVMMAAMMLPSVAPTVALYARMTRSRSHLLALLFVGGYLLTWALAGLLALAVGKTAGWLGGTSVQWGDTGRFLAGVTLLVAGAYQLSPLKGCLSGKVPEPARVAAGLLAGRPSRRGQDGHQERHLVCRLLLGAYGIAVRARRDERGLDGLRGRADRLREDPKPWKRMASYGIALLLFALGGLLLGAPHLIPAFTIPSSHMQPMGSMRP